MRIGIPKILWYHEYYPFWEVFFKNLGLEIVLSDDTNKKILEDSLLYSPDELCLPARLAYGHILNLSPKVDYLFLPYMSSSKKGTYECLTIFTLPDLIRNSIDNLPKLIDNRIDCNKKRFYLSVFEIGIKFNNDLLKLYLAYKKAQKETEKFRKEKLYMLNKGNNKKIKIGILSHLYVIYDKFIGTNILNKLREFDISLITPDMIPYDKFSKNLKIPNDIIWYSEKKKFISFHYFLHKKVDGIINVTPFCCGPGSIVDEIIFYETKSNEIPFLQIIIDEHTALEKNNIRIEIFIDLIMRKKK